MKIVEKENKNIVRFADLKLGDIFKIGTDAYFMKIQARIVQGKNATLRINAINLSNMYDWDIACFAHDDMVIPYDAELHVKPKEVPDADCD